MIWIIPHILHDENFITAKPLHNHNIGAVHFNHFYCTEICDKLKRDFAMFIYIYLNQRDYTTHTA